MNNEMRLKFSHSSHQGLILRKHNGMGNQSAGHSEMWPQKVNTFPLIT